MATPPRGRSNTKRNGAQNKRPTTIDLDAKDIEDTSENSAKVSATGNTSSAKTTSSTKHASATTSRQPATNKSSANPTKPSVPNMGSAKKIVAKAASGKTDGSKSESLKGSGAKPPSPEKLSATAGKTKPKTEPGKKGGPVPVSANNSSGFGKLAAAGIIGGVITLGGAGFMQYSDMLPNLGPISDAQPLPTIDLTPLQSKITSLQDQLDGLSGTSAQTVDLTPLENRLVALENSPGTPSTSTNTSSLEGGDVQKIEERIAQLSSEIAALKSTAESTAVKLSEIEDSTPKQDAGTLIDLAIAPIKNTTEQTNTKLGELEKTISALSTKIDEDVNARISAFDEKLKNAATGEKLAKSVAINALKSAVEKGEPFSGALVSLETLMGPSKPIEWLKSVASSGIPTDQKLQSEFGALQSKILLAATNDPNATITDRLMSSISSLVTVSSSDPVQGGSAQAIVSRVAANLKSGNFGAAISEWKSLPDEAQQASKSWMEKLNLRMDADRQMYKLLKSVQAGN